MNHVWHFAANKTIDSINDMNMIEFDNARNDAAYEFLKKEMNFNDREIKMFRSKLSNSTKDLLLWIEVGESNIAKNIL